MNDRKKYRELYKKKKILRKKNLEVKLKFSHKKMTKSLNGGRKKESKKKKEKRISKKKGRKKERK